MAKFNRNLGCSLCGHRKDAPRKTEKVGCESGERDLCGRWNIGISLKGVEASSLAVWVIMIPLRAQNISTKFWIEI